jgi:hypothetical protein
MDEVVNAVVRGDLYLHDVRRPDIIGSNNVLEARVAERFGVSPPSGATAATMRAATARRPAASSRSRFWAR